MTILGTPAVTPRNVSTVGETTIVFTVMQKIMVWLQTTASEDHCFIIMVNAVSGLVFMTPGTSSVGHAAQFVPPRHG
jgi:hypothetical protein